MIRTKKLKHIYHICTIDIGSPKLGNLGWCLYDSLSEKEFTGQDIDQLFPYIKDVSQTGGLILGLEAPLFVPIRENLMLATKGRKGEGKRPWSAGAGAQVLAMNLPIMIYILKGIQSACPYITFHINEVEFTAEPQHIMLFEALVSGADKGASHVHDAQIMVENCIKYAKKNELPESILENESNTEYFNLIAAALLRLNIDVEQNIKALSQHSPIYKPDIQYRENT
tara:strand:- start:2151 stop:2828 length:678 start_codon:yes stop_codon:yes gene_type:complete